MFFVANVLPAYVDGRTFATASIEYVTFSNGKFVALFGELARSTPSCLFIISSCLDEEAAALGELAVVSLEISAFVEEEAVVGVCEEDDCRVVVVGICPESIESSSMRCR